MERSHGHTNAKTWQRSTKPIPNYRPIALTSCLCKTMERMINARLVWFLEKNNIFTKYQSDFRKGRTTTDQLIWSESFIRDSFLKGNHVVSVFFYLEKAYLTRMEYGCAVFSSACKSYLKKLEPIQNQGLCICLQCKVWSQWTIIILKIWWTMHTVCIKTKK